MYAYVANERQTFSYNFSAPLAITIVFALLQLISAIDMSWWMIALPVWLGILWLTLGAIIVYGSDD